MSESVVREMPRAKVYYATSRIDHQDSRPAKLRRLLHAAGFDEVDLFNQFVAIKSHIGEIDTVSALRPVYARTVAGQLKEMQAKPFMVDCTTLYPGMRSDAIGFLECAELNGYTAQSCGCPLIIGDGLRGIDDVIVPIEGGKLLKSAYIGRAVMDSDYLVTLTHAKGCAATGFAGCLKNVAMGCASRGGKMVMHHESKPLVDTEICIGCGKCLSACAQEGITLNGNQAFINEKCVGCGHCMSYCRLGAIQFQRVKQTEAVQIRIAEYAAAVLKQKPAFHISLAIDITPFCDCFAGNDSAIVGDVGMLASFDPVALDKACVDLINKQTPLANTRLTEALSDTSPEDYFSAISVGTDWEICNLYAQELGLGTRDYELIEVD